MWWRLYLVSFLLLGLVANSQMSVPVPVETSEYLIEPIYQLLGVAHALQEAFGFQNFIVYSDCPHIRPSLQQRLMETVEKSIFAVTDFLEESPNDQYIFGVNTIIVLFSNADDPIMRAVDHNERLNIIRKVFIFLYVPPMEEQKPPDNDTIHGLFKFCWKHGFDSMLLLFQGEIWTFKYFRNMTYIKMSDTFYLDFFRSLGLRYRVQVAVDPPISFWVSIFSAQIYY